MKLFHKHLFAIIIFSFSNSSYALTDGQCVAPLGLNGPLNKTGSPAFILDNKNLHSQLNDSLGSDVVVTTGPNDRLAVGTDGGQYELFCRCDTGNTNEKPVKYRATVDGTPTGGLQGYTFYAVVSKDAEDNDTFPFEVGATVAFEGGHKPVPGDFTGTDLLCTGSETFNNESGTTISKAMHHFGGLAKLVFRRKGAMPIIAGVYTFTFPTISVVAENTNASSPNFAGPAATTFNFNIVTARIYNSCELETPILNVNLGALSSSDFSINDGEKPVDYEKRSIELHFTCNGTASDQADFFITDSFNPANDKNYLTTDLSGIGIAIDAVNTTLPDQGRVKILTRYNDILPLTDTKNTGKLQLNVYPIKVPGTVATGIYRGKANIVIENY